MLKWKEAIETQNLASSLQVKDDIYIECVDIGNSFSQNIRDICWMFDSSGSWLYVAGKGIINVLY